MFFLCACGSSQPPVTTVIVTSIAKETQIVDVTRVVEVTRIVQETRIATVEITRMIQEVITETPVPPSGSLVEVIQWIALQLPRAQHTATFLSDGRVLLVGGSVAPNIQLADVEIYNPATGITTLVAPLHTPRLGHTATLLSDGRVLVVGGYNHTQLWLDDAEIYDPYADIWTVVPMLTTHGGGHTATLMADGRVLVVGGVVGSGKLNDQVEIFDPHTNSWYAAMPLESERASHTSQLLEDGRVLVAGGGSATGFPAGGDAIIYDPKVNDWLTTGAMVKPRIFGESVRLLDGRVLVVGGVNLEDTLSDSPNQKKSASAEIFDPISDTWTATGELSQARYGHVIKLLLDGRVLVSGGARDGDCCWTNDSFVREIEVYDPESGAWIPAGDLLQPAIYSAGILLPDGRVWITGGQSGESGISFWSDTWLITSVFPSY